MTCKSAAVNLDDSFSSLRLTMSKLLHSHNIEHSLFGSGCNYKEKEMEQESKAIDWRISARYDLGTVLVSLYRIDYGNGKWTRIVFFWMVNSAATNSGILYKRNCDMKKVPSRQRMDLLTFISSDSESLLLTGKTIQSRRGLPTSSQQQEDLCGPSRKNPAQRDIQENARRDQVGYWSEMQAIRPRFRVCSKSSHIYCTKCMAFSFFSESTNCFKTYIPVQLRQTPNRGNKPSLPASSKDTASENRGRLLATNPHDPTSRCLTSRRSAWRSVTAGH
ncbi:hypothetical protein T07_12308 [Trichinella nelsoni]|uniref:PiggyBac transposable element-derived protein domain-containing protein n=1 Tax=Trichinella nelsoni TaxID=6336 RepID=A0A0V0SF81_9BILA|nr:hypothetical protein T07_12308 [Trichinella nelsoni]